MNVQFSRIPTMSDMGFRPTGFKSLGQANLSQNGQPAPSPSPAPAPAPAPVAPAPVQQVSFLTPAPYFAYAVQAEPAPVPVPVPVPTPAPAAADNRMLLIAGAVVVGLIAGIVLSR